MNALVAEWIAKAEADLIVALRELRARKQPSLDAIAFHSQQCIEKYLKAFLTDRLVEFPRTHDLEELLALAVESMPLWWAFNAGCQTVTKYAVKIRYPGETATRVEAREAITVAREIVRAVRSALGLSITRSAAAPRRAPRPSRQAVSPQRRRARRRAPRSRG